MFGGHQLAVPTVAKHKMRRSPEELDNRRASSSASKLNSVATT